VSFSLAADLLSALGALAAERGVLVALDFDGTLAPLVDDPEKSHMLGQARSALERLTEVEGVKIALVSGRAIESLARVADPMPEWFLVGSHGVETVAPGLLRNYAPSWEVPRDLENGFRSIGRLHPGTRIELKPFGIALHTRGLTEEAAQNAERDAVQWCLGWDPAMLLRKGHGILECAVRDAKKGDGVRHIVALSGSSRVLFAGDDQTDEDVFSVMGDADVSIKVGPGSTKASFRVKNPTEFAQVLTILAHQFFLARSS
jgi:trehalose-phosphatase